MLAILKDIFLAPRQSLDRTRFFIGLALLLQLELSSTLGQRYLISVIENADRNGTDPFIGNKLQVLLEFFQPTWVLGDLPMLAICYLLARGVCGRFLAPLLAFGCYVLTRLPRRLAGMSSNFENALTDGAQPYLFALGLVTLATCFALVAVAAFRPGIGRHPLAALNPARAASSQISASAFFYKNLLMALVVLVVGALLSWMASLSLAMLTVATMAMVLLFAATVIYWLVLVVKRLNNAGLAKAPFIGTYLGLSALIGLCQWVLSLEGEAWQLMLACILAGTSQMVLTLMTMTLLVLPAKAALEAQP
ncbi:hypothetical protein [Gallaecimonas pentaromativorans]|uniref:Uncharacterized protein n=1 Tax=Gallaecimonas pentaromativorans TaxID=584787 RepID=A0A3N1PFI0_9GAMM|nr:hypothetical protein [Gallaecimonas pentaromativorans]ROQ23276.1 hypothetical protein EDC28_10814 [Gallaecimonas pentaromativorans]